MVAAASPSCDRVRTAQARHATPRQLGVSQGLRLRGLRCSPIRRPAATRRGAGRPRRWVSARRTREGSTKFPSASWWRAWTHGGGFEEAARPSPSARSHCAPETRVQVSAPEVSRSRRPRLFPGFAGPGTASSCRSELFPRRKEAVCCFRRAPSGEVPRSALEPQGGEGPDSAGARGEGRCWDGRRAPAPPPGSGIPDPRLY